jgi:hypothetical protein
VNAPGIILLSLLCAARLCAAPDQTAALVQNRPEAAALLERSAIAIRIDGRAAVPFNAAVDAFLKDGVLQDVQRAYAEMLGPGETPEFEIEQLGPTTYHYVNRSMQTSRIEEVARAQREADTFDVAYFVAGERAFGAFQALIHVTVRDLPGPDVRYDVAVYAYPENVLLRFLGRLAVVRSYFRHKTREVTGLALAICLRIVGPVSAAGSGPA